MRQHTQTTELPRAIGVLLPNLNAGYDMAVLAGVQAVARQQHAQAIAIWGSPGDAHTTALAFDQVAGWIVVLNIPRPERILGSAQTHKPLVVIGATVADLGCPAVLPDNYGGTLAAVRHLIAHGHRRIAFLGDLRFDDIRERYAAYRDGLLEEGLQLDANLVFTDMRYYGLDGGVAAAQRIIREGFPCSAVVAANDLYALTLIDTLQQAGYQVPRDLAVVGFDDLLEARSAAPALTTVRQSYTELGRTAAGLLLAQLRGETSAAGITYIPTGLVVRRSCGCGLPSEQAALVEAYPAADHGWHAHVLAELTRLATDQSLPIWPEAADLIQGLTAAIDGTTPLHSATLEQAWRAAVSHTQDLTALHAMVACLEQAADSQIQSDEAAKARVRAFLANSRHSLMQALYAAQQKRITLLETLVHVNHAISTDLLGHEPGGSAQLAWLRHTGLNWACLGRWSEPDDQGRPTLVIMGTYGRLPNHEIGAQHVAALFPALHQAPAVASAQSDEVLILMPVRIATRNWGVLAIARHVESRSTQWADEDVRIWATLLGAALERESLLEPHTDQREMLSIAYEQQLITENIHDLIFMIDTTGSFLYVSPSFKVVLGYRPHGLLGISVFDLIHADDVAIVQDSWAHVRTPIPLQATFRFMHADGSWRWLEVSGMIVTRHGRPAIAVVGRDITERKQLEAEVLRAQKMESIGRLAGGVAHDFNNLMTVISGYASLALDSLNSTEAAISDLEEIQKAAQRATALTSQLLAFARKQKIAPRLTNLNDLILDMNRLLQRVLGEHIELVTLPDPQLQTVKVDTSQIEQILVNLAVNARDAMPNGGRLTITTTNISDPKLLREHSEQNAARYVCLTLSDSGEGMSAEVQAHVFEPFFTTKGSDGGTGLGLATCYGIVQQHGGSITVESTIGRGTTFRILLPSFADQAEVLPSATSRSSGQQLHKAETVLLVEDDQAVRNLAIRVLRAEGYTVLEAYDGEEALRIARSYQQPIDLLLTDVIMPRLGGIAVAEYFRAQYPTLKILLMSGYIGDAQQQELNMPLLPKPFTPTTLVQKVRAILEH